jgi:hypothetical protein
LFKNRALRKLFRPKRQEVTGGGENYIKKSVVNFFDSGIESRRIRWHSMGHIGFWWVNLKEIDNLEDLGADRSLTLKRVLKE